MKKIDFPAWTQKHKTYLLGAPNTSEAVAKEKAVTVVAGELDPTLERDRLHITEPR
jgi:hypothetical protein